MSKFTDYVTEEQFSEDAMQRTKQILEIVISGIDEAMVSSAVAGDATEAEMAKVIGAMFAGQAAIFQALHTNVLRLGKHGLITEDASRQVAAAIKVLSNAVMASIVTLHIKRGDAEPAKIIPFPGSQKVH